MPNIFYINISATYPILLYLHLLIINFIIIKSYNFINIAILLIILLKFLKTIIYYFLNKNLNKEFKNKISLNIIGVLIIITLFYNIKLYFYVLIIFFIILILYYIKM